MYPSPAEPSALVEKWKRHFQKMNNGKIRINHSGNYSVTTKPQQEDSVGDKQSVKFVTPVAQAVELAKSELKTSNDSVNDVTTNNNYKGTNRSAIIPQRIKKRRLQNATDALS